jgi:hypothetical protein
LRCAHFGVLTFTNDVICVRLGQSLGPDANVAAPRLHFQPFLDVEQRALAESN